MAANCVATSVATKSGEAAAWERRGRLHPAVIRMVKIRIDNPNGFRITKAVLRLAVIIVKSHRIAKTEPRKEYKNQYFDGWHVV